MPQQRLLLGADRQRRIERVIAAPRAGWGPLYRAPNQRWVMPGTGGVQLRRSGEHVVVDALTAFQLAPGDLYQLRYERERDHVVLSEDTGPSVAHARAWLLAPADLLRVWVALRALADGEPFARVTGALRAVLARSRCVDGRPQPAALVRAREFIMADASGGHSIDEIGEAAGASPFQLERLARRHLGLPLHQYRLRLRVAEALAHLARGERDIAGLAHGLGFSSQSHFGAVFRRETGCTPAAARGVLARPSGAGIR